MFSIFLHCSAEPPIRMSLRKIMLVQSEVIAIILDNCLSHSVEIFKELQFWAATVICGKPYTLYTEGQKLLLGNEELLRLLLMSLVESGF